MNPRDILVNAAKERLRTVGREIDRLSDTVVDEHKRASVARSTMEYHEKRAERYAKELEQVKVEHAYLETFIAPPPTFIASDE